MVDRGAERGKGQKDRSWIRTGEEDTRDLAQNAKEDEEHAAEPAGGAVCAARDGNDTIVLITRR